MGRSCTRPERKDDNSLWRTILLLSDFIYMCDYLCGISYICFASILIYLRSELACCDRCHRCIVWSVRALGVRFRPRLQIETRFTEAPIAVCPSFHESY